MLNQMAQASAEEVPDMVFRQDLTEQCDREGHSIPLIVTKCVEFIEKHGERPATHGARRGC